jgi:hypothetical protein
VMLDQGKPVQVGQGNGFQEGEVSLPEVVEDLLLELKVYSVSTPRSRRSCDLQLIDDGAPLSAVRNFRG